MVPVELMMFLLIAQEDRMTASCREQSARTPAIATEVAASGLLAGKRGAYDVLE